MRIYGFNDDSPLSERRPVVTIGVFDGVHLGHQAIIRKLCDTARDLDCPSLAITFATHPRLALGRAAPPGICSLETRIRLLAEAGLDAIWVLPFTAEFSKVSGRAFAEEYFHRRLNASAVVLGESAAFGHARGGNAHTLAEWATAWRIPVKAVPPLLINASVVSSTAVRLAVKAGDLDKAAAFLGRRFSVQGTVVRGQGHGKLLGFPTLNLDPHHELRPPSGVYLTRAVIDGVKHPSLTNIGRPPTEAEIEAGLIDLLIETHLLGYQGDLYRRNADIVFIEKTRDVMRFESMEELARQVHGDLAAAREWFARNPEA